MLKVEPTQKDGKVISDFVNIFLKTSLDVVQVEFVTQIPSESVKSAVSSLIVAVKQMIDILSDNEVNNKERIEKLWLEFAHDDVISFGEKELQKLFVQIQDQKLRTMVETVSKPVLDTLRALTDEQPKNEEQIGQVWEDFIKNPQVQAVLVMEVVKPLLEDLIKNKSIAAFVVGIIMSALSALPTE